MISSILRWFEPELAHDLALKLSRFAYRVSPSFLRTMCGIISTRMFSAPVTVWGIQFRNPLGMAAGFDKNAEWIEILAALGFGFVEIGTVTPRLQSGNLRPRLFRMKRERALFNSMGFNNLGASIISQRVCEVRSRNRLPAGFRIGVNLGKNKDTSNQDAHLDYLRVLQAFQNALPDYFVVNVSSPNTPGLRQLQDYESLVKIVRTLRLELQTWAVQPPLLIKLAPELDWAAFGNRMQELESEGVSGWVLTNTLRTEKFKMTGGLSGLPLQESSRAALGAVRKLTAAPLVSVGGVDSPNEMRKRLNDGAQLIQVYSGFVLKSPRFVVELLRNLPLTLRDEQNIH